VETIEVHIPRVAIGDELSREFGERGLHVERVDDGEVCALCVSFADPHERLLVDVTQTIEGWLADRDLPLVVQRANGGCVVRPPGD
jgi:hypothetical protein